MNISKKHRAFIVLSAVWLGYVTFRTDDYHYLFGLEWDKWAEDEYWLNLLIPLVGILLLSFAWHWIQGEGTFPSFKRSGTQSTKLNNFLSTRPYLPNAIIGISVATTAQTLGIPLLHADKDIAILLAGIVTLILFGVGYFASLLLCRILSLIFGKPLSRITEFIFSVVAALLLISAGVVIKRESGEQTLTELYSGPNLQDARTENLRCGA